MLIYSLWEEKIFIPYNITATVFSLLLLIFPFIARSNIFNFYLLTLFCITISNINLLIFNGIIYNLTKCKINAQLSIII